MPEYLAPGVYVEEINTGNQPIEGVSTSTVGFLGLTQRGPTVPTLVTSFVDYVRTFGGYLDKSYLPNAVEGFFLNGGKRCFVQRVYPGDAASAKAAAGQVNFDAIGPGAWANKALYLKVSDAGVFNKDAKAGPDGKVPGADLFKLTVIYWDRATIPDLPDPPLDPTDAANLRDAKYRAPTAVETYDNLSPDPTANNFYQPLIDGASNLIKVSQPATVNSRPGNTNGSLIEFAGGGDGTGVTLADVQGDPAKNPGEKIGLAALEEIDDISLLCCPDENDTLSIPNFTVADLLVAQCERLMDRFAIIQAPQTAGDIGKHYPSSVSKYAAYYYPWLNIVDPVTSKQRLIPPGGHVAGIYARSDTARGVHKAPANEVIRGLYVDPQDPGKGLQVKVAKGQQDLLNPRGVNCLRFFPGTGNLVWGARTTTHDPQWKYVNVRRLFIFVEKSIERSTQWVVFEPNDEPLWATLRRSVGGFLRRLWMDGMLQGAKKEEAYFVKCDRTTMTQDDIDNGRLIMVIGIAPVKPAEFVIFRIGQWAGGSQVDEG
jgi:phage tail sheath protein FI